MTDQATIGAAGSAVEEQAYLAMRADCDCVTMAVMERTKVAAKEVAKAIRNGERVNRVSAETVRVTPFRCPAHARPKP